MCKPADAARGDRGAPGQAGLEKRIREICETRVPTIVDTVSRFSPAIDAGVSYRGEDVVATLERVCTEAGFPKSIRVDRGRPFVSRDLDLWACPHGAVLDVSRPGKPTDNLFMFRRGEAPHGTLADRASPSTAGAGRSA